jgi:hypothetical protein
LSLVVAGVESFVETLSGGLRIVELVAGIRVECRESRRQRHVRGDAPVGGRGAEQVLQVDGGLQALGRDPTFGGFGGEVRRHAQRSGWKSRTCTVVEPIRSGWLGCRPMEIERV